MLSFGGTPWNAGVSFLGGQFRFYDDDSLAAVDPVSGVNCLRFKSYNSGADEVSIQNHSDEVASQDQGGSETTKADINIRWGRDAKGGTTTYSQYKFHAIAGVFDAELTSQQL